MELVMSDFQTAIIAKILLIKNNSHDFSKKTARWRPIEFNGKHVSEIDFYTLSPEDLAQAFFIISTRYIKQM